MVLELEPQVQQRQEKLKEEMIGECRHASGLLLLLPSGTAWLQNYCTAQLQVRWARFPRRISFDTPAAGGLQSSMGSCLCCAWCRDLLDVHATHANAELGKV